MPMITANQLTASDTPRLTALVRDTAGAVADLENRLGEMLDRLRGPVPQAVSTGATPPTNCIQSVLENLRDSIERCRSQMGDLEGLL